jgi:hypothetical protein
MDPQFRRALTFCRADQERNEVTKSGRNEVRKLRSTDAWQVGEKNNGLQNFMDWARRCDECGVRQRSCRFGKQKPGFREMQRRKLRFRTP